MIAKLFSIAKVSNFCTYAPQRLMFDVGEGASQILHNEIYAVEKLFISHGHWDHIGGLTGFILSRMSSKGANDKPLDIYCSQDAYTAVKRCVDAATPDFKVTIHQILYSDMTNFGFFNVKLTEDYYVRCFPVLHQPGKLNLGFAVVNIRQRLNPMGQRYIHDMKTIGGPVKVTNDMYEKYDHNEFVYLLDSGDYDIKFIQNADLVIFDATFANPEDKENNSHFTWHQAIQDAKNANVNKFVLAHNSRRYWDFNVFIKKYNLDKNDKFLGWTNPFNNNPYIIDKKSKTNYTFTTR